MLIKNLEAWCYRRSKSQFNYIKKVRATTKKLGFVAIFFLTSEEILRNKRFGLAEVWFPIEAQAKAIYFTSQALESIPKLSSLENLSKNVKLNERLILNFIALI